jgi:chromosome segregation ATPase
MSDTPTHSALEAARARLEAALSALGQGVATSRESLDAAMDATTENTALADRLKALEQENLKLHEQIAAYALKPEPDDEIQSLKQTIAQMDVEKASIKDELDTAISELQTMLEDA